MTVDPAVAAVRLGVRRVLDELPDPAGRAVLVACSGGADSLALLAAALFEARRPGLRVLGVTVDHGLQGGSAELADRVVAQMAALGAHETIAVRVRVDPGGAGIEAAAREARYAVLAEVAERSGAALVLLGHTRDDQAETVLLRLLRGAGASGLSAMRPRSRDLIRPLLGVSRAQVLAYLAERGLTWVEDPTNSDPAYATRNRVRHEVLPLLARINPNIAATLAPLGVPRRGMEVVGHDLEPPVADCVQWIGDHPAVSLGRSHRRVHPGLG